MCDKLYNPAGGKRAAVVRGTGERVCLIKQEPEVGFLVCDFTMIRRRCWKRMWMLLPEENLSEEKVSVDLVQ